MCTYTQMYRHTFGHMFIIKICTYGQKWTILQQHGSFWPNPGDEQAYSCTDIQVQWYAAVWPFFTKNTEVQMCPYVHVNNNTGVQHPGHFYPKPQGAGLYRIKYIGVQQPGPFYPLYRGIYVSSCTGIQVHMCTSSWTFLPKVWRCTVFQVIDCTSTQFYCTSAKPF